MNNQPENRIDELIAQAALGELSESDELELDALLATDPSLSSEVDDAVETGAMLMGAVAEAPPSGLRDSVLSAIAGTPQELTKSDGVPAPVIDLASRRRSKFVMALSAAAAFVLLAGVGLIFARGDSVSNQDRLAAEAAVVISADDAVERMLEGELGGTLTVVFSPGEQAIVIDGEGLPVLGEDRAFVLWFVDEDVATPVQTFRPDASGDVLVRVDGVDPTDFVLGITEEDAGGADVPTTPVIASA